MFCHDILNFCFTFMVFRMVVVALQDTVYVCDFPHEAGTRCNMGTTRPPSGIITPIGEDGP